MGKISGSTKLDIGCGKRPLDGWQGLDLTLEVFDGVLLYDMIRDTLPYVDDSVDAIRCINTLEHVERKYYKQIFNDWWRVLKPGGSLEIVVPNATSIEHAWGDITHVSPWVKMTFRYLTGERPRYADYGFKQWTILKLEDHEIDDRDIYALLTPKIDTKTNKKYE